MRFLPLIVSAFFLFTDTLAIADPRGSTSWGKAGVSLSRFALDANECSETSRTVAVSIKRKHYKHWMFSAAQPCLISRCRAPTGRPRIQCKP